MRCKRPVLPHLKCSPGIRHGTCATSIHPASSGKRTWSKVHTRRSCLLSVPEVSGHALACYSAISASPASPQNLNVYRCDVLESDSMSTGEPAPEPVHRSIRNGLTPDIDLSGTQGRPIGNGVSIHQEQSLDTPGTRACSDSACSGDSARVAQTLTCLTLIKPI